MAKLRLLQPKIPAYRLHRASGQAIVTEPGTGGKTIYLGEYDSADSRQRYGELVAEWIGGKPAPPVDDFRTPTTYTVGKLVLDYIEHVTAYYRGTDGRPTSQIYTERKAMAWLVGEFETTECADFGPRRLKHLQRRMAETLSRNTVNSYIVAIRRAFSWGVSEQSIPGSVTHALREVPNLKAGRSTARETEPVGPVAIADVDKVLPLLSPVLRGVVSLQLASGARPSEILALRPSDIDTSGPTWRYNVASHKNAYRGHKRVICFGPKAQEVLRPFLVDRAPDSYVFSPSEAVDWQTQQRAEYRQTPRYRSHMERNRTKRKSRPKRSAGERYTVPSYRRAIARACQKLEIPVWSPHQLRHTAATAIRAQFGLEAAQVVLGHSDPQVTQRYAEKNTAEAARIMAEIG